MPSTATESRTQHSGDRCRFRLLLPTIHCGRRLVGWLDAEEELHEPVLEMGGHVESCSGEDGQHLPVVGQRRGREVTQPVVSTGSGQVLQQQRGEAAAVVLVVDEEGDLGGVGARVPLVSGHRDYLAVEKSDERHAVAVIDLGEVHQLGSGETRASARGT